MKKLVLMFSCVSLFIFLISLASAEIKLSKETYAPSETLQAEIYGNFLDTIKPENIYFYRERNVPVIYDILKLKDKYLLYALLPTKEGNYTIKIKNTRYETETGISEAEIIKEFSIKTTNETILSINPGFIAAREDFYIKVKTNKNLNIDIEFLEEKQNLSLIENKEEKIYFSIAEIKNYTETNIKIQNYEIPIFIFPESSIGIEEVSKFRFSPQEIEATILKGESYFFKVALINLGKKDINDITLSLNISDKDLEIKIEPSFLSQLKSEEREFVNLTFTPNKLKNFSFFVFASSENLSAELKINIEVTKNISEVNYSIIGYAEGKTCEELGKFCTAEEKCDAALVLTEEGYCCQGNCIEKRESSSWLYGLIIIIVLVVGLILFSLYMKKRQKPIDILKERQEKYEKRMKGEEIRGGLAKT